MIIIGKGKDVRNSDSFFPVVPYNIIYNLIIEIRFTSSLDVVASSIHLKLKFHNLHSELITHNVDLAGAEKFYQALQQDQN